jgi:hypothetical protein
MAANQPVLPIMLTAAFGSILQQLRHFYLPLCCVTHSGQGKLARHFYGAKLLTVLPAMFANVYGKSKLDCFFVTAIHFRPSLISVSKNGTPLLEWVPSHGHKY